MFILNDPYRGAIHQPDVSIVAPIFHRGKHVAWAGSCAHQLDVGGMSFGSWAIGASRRSSRRPCCFLASGRRRRRFSRRTCGTRNHGHDASAAGARARSEGDDRSQQRRCPPVPRIAGSVWGGRCRDDHERGDQRHRAPTTPNSAPNSRTAFFALADYIEHDGHENRLYHVCVTATKSGDSLTLDINRHVAAGAGIINCTASGMRGAALTRTVAESGADNPLERRRHAGGDDRCAGGDTTSERNVAGAGLLRDDFNSVDRSECRRPLLSHAWSHFPAEFAKEGPAVTKGDMTVMTLRRGGSRRRPDSEPSSSIQPPEVAARTPITMGSTARAGPLRATACDCECRSERGQWTVPVSLSWVRPRTGGPGRMRGGVGASFGNNPIRNGGPARDDAGRRRRSAEFDRRVRRSSRRLRTQLYPPGRRRHANDRRSRRQFGRDARSRGRRTRTEARSHGPRGRRRAWIRLPGWRRLPGSDQT